MTRRDSNSKDGTPGNQNVFDDEFALDPDEDDFMSSASDDFGPSMMGAGQPPQNNLSNTNAPPSRSLNRSASSTTNPTPTETDLRRMATRNSTAKVSHGQGTTTAAERHAMPPLPSQPSSRNRDSVSSTASFATTAQSELGTGPSHPYAMYAQNTMARSPSVSTASTRRQSQTPVAMQRPAHPYGMYTQNVVVEDEPPMPLPMPQTQNTIPLGFTGINAAVGPGYRRQIGPDGEEQDIIGPDGHTEQLPPYSRYPEEGPTKASLAAEASATSVGAIAVGRNLVDESNETLLVTSDSPSPTSPVSPISHITPPASVTPARLPPQRPETQTGNTANPRPATTSESASLLTSTDDGVMSEKAGLPAEKKIPWRKRKLWGKIPVTMALVAVILLLIFAVVLGAAMGSVIAKGDNDDEKNEKKKNPHQDPFPQNSPSNTFFDATPISIPTTLPSLPAGQFSLPLGFAQESSPGCLLVGNQYAAWSCKMSFAPLMLTVMADDNLSLSLESFTAPDGSIQYGLQPPLAFNQTLQLVMDLDYKGYGPAWHFSTRYDKIVVLTPDEFTAGSFLRARQIDKSYRHRFQVQPGDNPWLCYWNQTYIEGYIYVQNNSTAATVTGYPTPNPTDPFAPMQYPSTASFPSPTTTTTVPIPTSTTSTGSAKRDDNPPPFPRLPPYPRTVKIEERRLPGAPQPYCQKMQLLDNGKLSPMTTTKGDSIVVLLQEQDPRLEDYNQNSDSSPTTRRKLRLDKRRDPPDACHCQWMFQ
ncbi:hypothetical protein DM02DRAFT_611190 [Periconia macrospinosa]|uniref:DUF7820 domain-containing protein n=1 Tax=Periconia macrospinosa TaxID=97972 RepID=A0A2V1E594_9PLEO|nr:hypothetical protein DM02DRAFT_611190 [Periconia macrospinosa]